MIGPEARTRQTAESLHLHGDIDPALRDLDCGQWAGLETNQIAPEQLLAWLTDPRHNPHEGETITDLLTRVQSWMDQLSAAKGRIIAVTHPAVIRAAILTALHAPPESFWRIDVAPLTHTTLHRRGQTWTLRTTGQSL